MQTLEQMQRKQELQQHSEEKDEPVRSKDARIGNQRHPQQPHRLSLREHKKAQREEAAASSHFLPQLGELMNPTLLLS